MSVMPIKLVVVGDRNVGKTSILFSYTQNSPPTDYVPAIFDNYASTLNIDQRTIHLGLWDTTGQEEYSKLRHLAYPHCDVFLIVFSVIDPSSFDNARKKVIGQGVQWYPELKKLVGNVPILFVGSKIELRDEYARQNKDTITKEAAERIIEEEFNCKYMECSALTMIGLEEIFNGAMRMGIEEKKKEREKKKQSKCCNACSLI